MFLEDTIDNCGLTVAKYIRETGQKTSLYFFGTSTNRAFYGYEYKAAHYLTDVGRILRTFKIKKNVEVTDNGKIII